MVKRKPDKAPADPRVAQTQPTPAAEECRVTVEQIERDREFLTRVKEHLHSIEIDLSRYVMRWSGRDGMNETVMRQELTQVMVKVQNSQNWIDKALASLGSVNADQGKLF